MKFENEIELDTESLETQKIFDQLFSSVQNCARVLLGKSALFDSAIDRIEECKIWVRKCVAHDQRVRDNNQKGK